MGQINVSAPDEIIQEWKEAAKARDMSLAQLVRRAMGAYMLLLKKQQEKSRK